MENQISQEVFQEIENAIFVTSSPNAYEGNENFISYMDDPKIFGFGKWMEANGYNVAILKIKIELEKRGILV